MLINITDEEFKIIDKIFIELEELYYQNNNDTIDKTLSVLADIIVKCTE